MNPEYLKVLDRLQRACVRREYCRQDIFRKALKALDGDRELAEQLTEALQADRFFDDSRYSCAFAREKSRLSGWGPAKISFALKGKGISSSVIAEALADVDQEEAGKKMMAVIAAKYKALKGDPAIRLKLLKFGLSRGYGYDDVAAVVGELLVQKD